MKKYLAYFTVALIMAIVCVGFTSCGGSDDDSNNVVSKPISIVGEWRYEFSSGFSMLNFRADGTFLCIEYDSTVSSYSSQYSGTYIFDSAQNLVTTTWGNDGIVYGKDYVLVGETLQYTNKGQQIIYKRYVK